MSAWTNREQRMLATYKGRGDLGRLVGALPRHTRRAIWERLKELRTAAKHGRFTKATPSASVTGS